MKKITYIFLLFNLTFFLTACGFHLQGEAKLAPPLHRMYLQTSDPYGNLASYLEEYLKMSNVNLVATPAQATTILMILKDHTSQDLISVSSTQQTRQYNLKTIVIFQITDANGRIIVAPQALSENRVMTVQASQILGSSNETYMIYQQMRRTLAYEIINRIASKEVTRTVNHAFSTTSHSSQS